MTTVAERLTEKLEPFNNGELVKGKTDLERYLEAIASIFSPVLEVAEEVGTQGEAGWVPGYGVIFNPTTCPKKFLPWLGMLVGVEVPKTATEAEAREQVKAESGLERGTRGALEMAIKKAIGATEPFVIQERTALNGAEAAYHFNVIVKKTKATQALKEAIEAVKPGGLMFSLIEVENAWVEGTKEWGEVAAGKTWATIVEGEY